MKNLIGVFCLGLVLMACQQKESPIVQEAIQSNRDEHTELIKRIDSLQLIVFADTFALNEATASELLKSYMEFTSKFSADKERSPEYLYKAAALSRGVKLPVRAIKYYQRILDEYPEFIKNSETAFLLAFTYDEDLNKPELAKEAYQYVVDTYPGDMWANQSAERLKTIDMSDEELIKFFMEKNKNQ